MQYTELAANRSMNMRAPCWWQLVAAARNISSYACGGSRAPELQQCCLQFQTRHAVCQRLMDDLQARKHTSTATHSAQPGGNSATPVGLC
jgi:hypothetical protein